MDAPTDAAQRPRITPTPPGDDRPILFVGDIQGCAREFAALLKASGFRTGHHRLIPVGDTINRGPDAPGVLTLLRDHKAEPILGNHELALLALAEAHPAAPVPPSTASAAWQLRQVHQWPAAMEWVREWPNGRSGPGWLTVHAGLNPALPLEETPPDYLATVRYCSPAGARPPMSDGKATEAPKGYQPWYALYRGERVVIYGHWAQQGLNLTERVRGLDSGCVYGGQLSGLWWPEDRLVQVESAQPPRRTSPARGRPG